MKSNIEVAILSCPDKRAPGPNRVRLEMLRPCVRSFADAATQMCEAVGRLGFVPSLLPSGLLSPVYKQEGEQSLPSNNRPICVISVFRRIIGVSLTSEVEKSYEPRYLQWGHRKGMDTECAVAYVDNALRRKLPTVALLDLKKAYDIVPRVTRQAMLDHRLPIGLDRIMADGPKTRFQTSQRCLLTRAGVRQVDPTSPQLFSLFMDSFLSVSNEQPRKSLASLFVDDVLVLAKTNVDLTQALDNAVKWPKSHDMIWNVG